MTVDDLSKRAKEIGKGIANCVITFIGVYFPEINVVPAQTLQQMAAWPEAEYVRYCQSARRAAEDYDFKRLTDKLIAVIENIPEREV